MRGLVVENIANLYKIKIENEIYEASVRGKLKRIDVSPVVGDVVECEIVDEVKKVATIENIEDRKMYIKRPKMANLSQLIFVVSSKHPKPDLLMLDKQLLFAEFLGIRAIIVLNKIDLDKDEEFVKISKLYEDIGYDVIKTDAKDGIGLDELKRKLKDNISAFSGNSGVRKVYTYKCFI